MFNLFDDGGVVVIILKQTSWGCPEQYDAFDENGNQVGYLRLRHGHFSVDYPNSGGETIYEASPNGDGLFDSDERDYYLKWAVHAILERIRTGKFEKPFAPDVDYKIEE